MKRIYNLVKEYCTRVTKFYNLHSSLKHKINTYKISLKQFFLNVKINTTTTITRLADSLLHVLSGVL